MQLRRRPGAGANAVASASLSTLHAALRHSSSSNNDKGSHDNGATHISDGRGGAGGGGGGVPPTAHTSTAFEGWKRFDLPRDNNTATTAAPLSSSSVMAAVAKLPPAASSPLSVLSRKGEDEVTRRQAASERLADMFVESGRHAQWMQKQHQQRQSGHSQHNDESRASVRLVEVQDSDLLAPVRSGAARPPDSRVRDYTYDEDEESPAPSGEEQYSSSLTPAAAPVEVLEHELLDDNYLYYPPAPLSMGEGVALTEHAPFGEQQQRPATASKPQERYVPGQQIIPPGFTRYRVDVQYQGGDFDGWFKSVQRSRSSAHATGSHNLSEGTSRHYARTVLEEALAVALDVATVSVVAAVIPETGVSVRRLCCHMDIPSEVELQSRTILQRATLWLHQRQQPLAILSCASCRNTDFHARHTGVRRVYCYRILNRIAPPLFDAGLQWHVDRCLDVPRMQRMAAVMTGTHDFGYFADPKMANALRRAAANAGGGGSGPVVSAAYSAEHEPLTSYGLPTGQAPAAPKVAISRGLTQLERAASLPTFNELGQRVVTYQAKPHQYFKAHTNLPTIRTIDKIDVVRQEDEVLIWFVGKSFLRHQIRNMVSVLKAGGHGLWDDQELQHALRSGFEVSRKKFARERLPPAPVHGLTLWDVDYPAQHTSDFVPYVDAGPYEPYDVSAQH